MFSSSGFRVSGFRVVGVWPLDLVQVFVREGLGGFGLKGSEGSVVGSSGQFLEPKTIGIHAANPDPQT